MLCMNNWVDIKNKAYIKISSTYWDYIYFINPGLMTGYMTLLLSL